MSAWPNPTKGRKALAERQAELTSGLYSITIEISYDRMLSGSVVLAHNSVIAARQLKFYLSFVRDLAHSRASFNLILDIEELRGSIVRK